MLLLHSNIRNRQHKIYPLYTLADVMDKQCSQQSICFPDDDLKYSWYT
jgi:hypothetical protein